jgi:hypothetical protein
VSADNHERHDWRVRVTKTRAAKMAVALLSTLA